MDRNYLERCLSVAFETHLSIGERVSLIKSDLSLAKIFENLEKEPKTKDVSQCVKWLLGGFGNALWFSDPCFPVFEPVTRGLPFVLFYKGSKPRVGKKITIVGTRFPTEDALQRAFSLGLEAQINGIDVVTGMANGIDQASARGALSVINHNQVCSMIGVLGCGLEIDYPAMTSVLKTKIIQNGGTILSQFAPFEPGLRQNFPNRNLTMAAFGNCTVVVQAPEKSGSLITSDFALQMGKDVFVTTEGISQNSKCFGSRNLYEDGAQVLDNLEQVFDTKCKVVKTTKLIKPFSRYGEYNYTIISENK